MDGLHMRRLFVLDSKDYDDTHSVTVKNTVRAIICRDGRYAMQQNREYIRFPVAVWRIMRAFWILYAGKL